MRPEWSIIILTVLAGAGQGIFFFLVGGDLVSPLADRGVTSWQVAAACALAAAFGGAGAGASFLHLHNKQRAAKAFAQWKYSWLSREALLLPVFLGAVVLYGALTLLGVTGVVRTVVGVAGVASGVALSVAQGMIYAVVKSIREWATPLTPLNFVLLGWAAGAVGLGAVFEITGAPAAMILTVVRAALGFTLLAFAVKLLTYRFNDTAWRPTSLRTATGFRSDEILLTDTGCSYAHYNTKEYFDAEAKKKIGPMRGVVHLLHFVIPVALMMVGYLPLMKGESGALLGVALLSMLAGGLAERWLFFVEGNHVQNHFYGTFPAQKVGNPILSPSHPVHPAAR